MLEPQIATPAPWSNIAGRAVSGVLWTMGANGVRLVVGFGGSIVMARLLLPEDYGAVALAMGIVFIINRLSSVGFEATMLRQSTLTTLQTSSLFWAKVIAVTLAYIICLGVALLARSVYSQTVILIIIVFGILQSLNAVMHVPGTLLQRGLKFKQFQLVEIAIVFISVMAGIAMAFGGWGPWSLVFSTGGGLVLNGSWKWYLTGWTPLLAFDSTYIRSQFHFSAGMLITGILEESAHRIDDILLGSFLGVRALGYYGMAYNLSQFYHVTVSGAVQQVALPVMGMVHEQEARLKDAVERIVPHVLYLGGLFYALLAPLAAEVITLLYGERWRPSALLLQGLALYGFLLPLFETSRLVLIVRGKSFAMAQVYAVQVFVLIGLLLALVPGWGAFGAVVAVDAMILVACALTVYFIQQEIRAHSPNWLMVIGRPALAALAAALATTLARQILAPFDPWVLVLASSLAGLLVWMAVIWMIDRQRVLDDLRFMLDNIHWKTRTAP